MYLSGCCSQREYVHLPTVFQQKSISVDQGEFLKQWDPFNMWPTFLSIVINDHLDNLLFYNMSQTSRASYLPCPESLPWHFQWCQRAPPQGWWFYPSRSSQRSAWRSRIWNDEMFPKKSFFWNNWQLVIRIHDIKKLHIFLMKKARYFLLT